MDRCKVYHCHYIGHRCVGQVQWPLIVVHNILHVAMCCSVHTTPSTHHPIIMASVTMTSKACIDYHNPHNRAWTMCSTQSGFLIYSLIDIAYIPLNVG